MGFHCLYEEKLHTQWHAWGVNNYNIRWVGEGLFIRKGGIAREPVI